jgi:iron(III) transport system permease protein
LAAVAAVALAVNQRLVQRGRALVGGKAGRANLVALGPWTPAAAAALWTLAALALVVPLGSLALTSFTAVWGQGLTPDNLTLDNYLSVLTDRRTLGAAWNSVWLAALAASACVAVGAVAAYARARTKLLGRELLPRAAELPYALPGTVLALGLLLTFSQPLWIGVGSLFYVKLWMLNTPWLLLVAYCAKYMAFGVRGADAALTQVDRSLEEAARISGATPWQTFTHVVVPLLRPALVASWVLVFLPVLGEITMSILLFGPQTKTLGVLLFDYQSYESPPKAAVLASLLALSVLGGDALVRRLTGGKLGL